MFILERAGHETGSISKWCRYSFLVSEGSTCTFFEWFATLSLGIQTDKAASTITIGRNPDGQRPKPAEGNEEETGKIDGGKTGRKEG
jgi:hypothetical protein